jgi:hypothetical protein
MIEIIKDILKGIDQTEIESPDGWWETSIGAEFGAEKLKQIVEIIQHHNYKQIYKPFGLTMEAKLKEKNDLG